MTQISTEHRQHWMNILARTPFAAIETAWATLPEQPEYTFLRQPETGLVMVQARTNGSGNAFSMGEITLTRCAVNINGTVGHAYIAGRDKKHAELAAVFDGLLQQPAYNDQLSKSVIEPMEKALTQKQQTKAEHVASTKVDFFTMVRGED